MSTTTVDNAMTVYLMAPAALVAVARLIEWRDTRSTPDSRSLDRHTRARAALRRATTPKETP